MKLVRAIFLGLVALVGCHPADDGRFDGDTTPGETPWNHSDQVTCQSHEECSDGEVCEEGLCRMARCLEAFESRPPMGDNHFFGVDGELAIISDESWVDAFEGSNGAYMSSWDLSGAGKVVDVAGGNLTGERPHAVAVAIQGSTQLRVNDQSIDVGIAPIAIAAGDTDADGVDEVLALAGDGSIALCDVVENQCLGASIQDIVGKDVAVGDVDGDGFEEPLLMIEAGGQTQLVVWNSDAAVTGQEESYGWQLNFPARAMSAGDIDGDGVAEVVLLEDGGWWGWASDKLRVFSPATEQTSYSHDISGYTLDVAAGDRDADEKAEIAILREGQSFELLMVNSQNQLVSTGTYPVNVGQSATRMSMVDWDGDTPSGRLMEGPELVAGKAVPIAALMFPPYPHDAVSEDTGASITLGDSASTDATNRDTLSLGVGIGLSFGAEAGVFKAKVGGYLNKDFSYTHSVTKSLSVGSRYSVEADPDLHGTGYAPVVMSCGCYHRYRYVTEDPAGRIGGSGQTVDIFLPVGGQTQLWSSKRYNAMAKAAGDLPIIEVPLRVGDVDSYPTTIESLAHQTIAQEDMLFPETPNYQISDVAEVNFWLVVGESETNEVAEKTTLGLETSFGAFGASVDAQMNIGVERGYAISVGSETIFAGGVPPVSDDSETPEDEYEIHRYSFKPFVYRQHYTDASGQDAAYYVLHFAAGQ